MRSFHLESERTQANRDPDGHAYGAIRSLDLFGDTRPVLPSLPISYSSLSPQQYVSSADDIMAGALPDPELTEIGVSSYGEC